MTFGGFIMETKVKKPFYKKWWVWAIVVVVIIGAIASGGNDSDKKPVDNPSKAAVSDSTKKDDKKDEVKEFYNVGEVANIKGLEMSVTKVEKSKGTEFDKPKDSMEYVIVTVKIKNNSKDKIAYNPFYFKMQNSKGQIQDGAFSIMNKDTALESGDLAPDGEVEGTLIYEEPIDDKALILQYQDNMFSDKVKLQFKLN